MASQSDESGTSLDIVAQIERLKLENNLKPLLEGSRDLGQLRDILDKARPRLGEPIYKFTDTVMVKFTNIIRTMKDSRNYGLRLESGAALFTSDEAVLVKNSIYVATQSTTFSEEKLHLDERICFYPQRKFKICQGGEIIEGVFTQALPSWRKPTLLEKLREDFELIPRELSEQIRTEIQKQAESSMPLNNGD